MNTVETLFKRKKPNYAKLLEFGFVEENDCFTYTKPIMKDQMQMIVKVTSSLVSAKVMDNVLAEEYVLHHRFESTGRFVGGVRNEYKHILTDIVNRCFEPDVFKSDCAQAVIKYIRQAYQDEFEYLWSRMPDNAIVRRKDNRKWYGAMLTIPKKKLGLQGDEIIEILNLKVKPEECQLIVDGKRYFQGYHMNKNHWITINLDGAVDVEEILRRIDDSYELSSK